jgi:hypothetical protein
MYIDGCAVEPLNCSTVYEPWDSRYKGSMNITSSALMLGRAENNAALLGQ